MFIPMTLRQTHSEEKALESNGYKLVTKLGEGGYAKVYLGEFSSLPNEKPERLACKVIDTSKLAKKVVQKFLPRELTILVKICHPHIVQIHSIFQRKSKYYIFMRFAEKGDLLEYVRQNGVLKEQLARFWMRQIGLAVQYLHTMEIAHRDLKCENILITSHNNVKLADFGFAKSNIGSNYTKELSETFCGSISYVPPEILRGQPYDPKIADLWSFGVIIYTILNGTHPFDPKNVKILYDNQINKKWKFRTKYVDSLSEQVKSLITNLLEPDLHKRFKIEQVISSSWIAMDNRLKTLNTAEYAALSAALEIANSVQTGQGLEGDRQRTWSSNLKKYMNNRNSLTFYKKYEGHGGFDLQFIRSDFQEVMK